jgi:RNA polymerase sigma-70 factor, ECF subfamily
LRPPEAAFRRFFLNRTPNPTSPAPIIIVSDPCSAVLEDVLAESPQKTCESHFSAPALLLECEAIRGLVLENQSEESRAGDITQCLQRWRDGDADALRLLTDAVYHELRRIAAVSWRSEYGPRTLQPTALVHELFLQLPGIRHLDWHSRIQFLNVSARMMRHILVDRARARRASRRGGEAVRVTWHPGREDAAMDIDVLVIHEALERFTGRYPRHARVVELRFFGGLTSQETADVLTQDGTESSLRTVERDWAFARAWLQDAIRTA